MTKNNISIRRATKGELKYILHLYRQLETDRKKNELSLPEAEAIFDRINQYPNYRIYVATFKEDVIGTFALLIMDNLAHGGASSGIVENVVVSPQWQGKGVGKQMMMYALTECRKQDCYKLVLSSNKTRVKAHRFYEYLGFKKHGYSFMIDSKG